MTILCIILHEWPFSEPVGPLCMSVHKADVNTFRGWGSLVRIYNTYAALLTSQCHEVFVESVHIPFIRPISTLCTKYLHPALPASQTPTLWSVSCSQILTEGEDIDSEGSELWSGGRGKRGKDYLVRHTSSQKDGCTCYSLHKLKWKTRVKTKTYKKLLIKKWLVLFHNIKLELDLNKNNLVCWWVLFLEEQVMDKCGELKFCSSFSLLSVCSVFCECNKCMLLT